MLNTSINLLFEVGNSYNLFKRAIDDESTKSLYGNANSSLFTLIVSRRPNARFDGFFIGYPVVKEYDG